MKTAYNVAITLNLPPLARHSVTSPDWVEKVLGFHHFYDVPIKPFGNTDREFTHMDNARVALRASFQVEEVLEMLWKGLGIQATVVIAGAAGEYPRVLTGDAKEDTAVLEQAMALTGVRNGKEVADACADSIYFWLGWMIEMGYDMREVMREVHASNMTKPDENGQPIKREDGKVMKGPNFVEPNIPAALGWENQ